MRVGIFFAGVFLGTLGSGLSSLGHFQIGVGMVLVAVAAMAFAGGVFEVERSDS